MSSRVRHLMPMALALAASTIACGSSGGGNGGTGALGTCAITITGAISATPQCRDFTATWTSSEGLTVVAFGTPDGAVTSSGTANFPGEPTVTTYSSSSGSADAFLAVDQGGQQWTGGTALGSFSLSITSVETLSSSASVKSYRLDGDLTAALVGDTTDSTVMLDVTF